MHLGLNFSHSLFKNTRINYSHSHLVLLHLYHSVCSCILSWHYSFITLSMMALLLVLVAIFLAIYFTVYICRLILNESLSWCFCVFSLSLPLCLTVYCLFPFTSGSPVQTHLRVLDAWSYQHYAVSASFLVVSLCSWHPKPIDHRKSKSPITGSAVIFFLVYFHLWEAKRIQLYPLMSSGEPGCRPQFMWRSLSRISLKSPPSSEPSRYWCSSILCFKCLTLCYIVLLLLLFPLYLSWCVICLKAEKVF